MTVPSEPNISPSSHGGGTSPMIYRDLVIITNDQVGESFLLAVDKRTGQEKWRIDRESVDNGTAYAVPSVYEEPGQNPQLIFASRADGLSGVDPETGKTIWKVKDLFPLRVVFSPLVVGDLVFAGCGQGGGGKRFAAVRPGSSDGKRPAGIAYELKNALPYVPTPVSYGNLVFIVNDGTGVGTCFDAASGAVKWKERLGGSFFGSPVCIDGKIYLISKKGEVIVFKASDSFEPLARNDLGEMSYTTPAVAGSALYLRTRHHLISVGGK
ncbi:MAG: PQQ-binding-like beta-propeller repeat protein [Verrucomicrobiota bacterium]